MTSMNEMSDNELDDLFRKSAEEMDIPFDAEAWQRMEKKLDGASRTDKNPWMRWGWLGLLLLLLSTGTYLWLKNTSDTDEKTEKKSATVAQAETKPASKKSDRAGKEMQSAAKNQATTGNTKPETASPTELQTSETKATIDTKQANDTKETNALSPGKSRTNLPIKIKSEEEQQPAMVAPTRTAEISRKKQASLSDANGRISADKKLRRFSTQNAPVATENGVNPAPSDDAEQTQRSVTSKNRLARKPKQTTEDAPKMNTPADKKIVSSENTKPLIAFPADTQLEANVRSRRLLVDNYAAQEEQRLYVNLLTGKTIEKQPGQMPAIEIYPEVKPMTKPPIEPRKPVPSAPRFGVRFVIAPDMSSVGFRNYVQPGTNVGILLEYKLTNRLLISTGALYTQKIYKAKGSDYNPPNGYWTTSPGYDLRTVNAGCNIIDLPVNLRYDVIQRERSNWFVTVGASSYLMKKEEYEYHYYYYGKYKVSDWSIKNSNNHFFAVGNLSLGYEHAMSRRLSWQVEPYLKLPLGGVGFGKIKLVSSGLFFSVKYHPFVRK